MEPQFCQDYCQRQLSPSPALQLVWARASIRSGQLLRAQQLFLSAGDGVASDAMLQALVLESEEHSRGGAVALRAPASPAEWIARYYIDVLRDLQVGLSMHR